MEKIETIREYIDEVWDTSCIPALKEYIKVPSQSPEFDEDERTNGLTERAAAILVEWAKGCGVEGMALQVLEEPGRTPFVFITVEPFGGPPAYPGTILMYGHLDKQPPMDDTPPGWAEGLGPYNPVERDGKLYGRGGADDGYSIMAALTSIRAVQRAGLSHGRLAVVIEACEESGSLDLEHYLEKIKGELGTVEMLVCLDSGALDYTTMYNTKSLRGIAGGILKVSLLKQGIHSGAGGGIVPCSFRVLRMLLSRIEDEATGEIRLKEFHTPLPEGLEESVSYLDTSDDKLISSHVYLQDGVKLNTPESQLLLNNTWRPCLTVTGADGLPPCKSAGNVLRMETCVKLSIRLPPRVCGVKATEVLKRTLEENPPYGAKVVFVPEAPGNGWACPPTQPWLQDLMDKASIAAFGKPSAGMGMGGTIPFLATLGELFPEAQFCTIGVLGPQSNAHGPNEFLHIPYTKKLVTALALIVQGYKTQ